MSGQDTGDCLLRFNNSLLYQLLNTGNRSCRSRFTPDACPVYYGFCIKYLLICYLFDYSIRYFYCMLCL